MVSQDTANQSEKHDQNNKIAEKPPMESPPEETSKGKISLWPQVVSAFFIAMTQMNTGAQYAYAAVAIPLLTDPASSDLVLSKFQVSTFASILYIGYLVFALSAGVFVTWFGQRKVLMASVPIGALGWIIQGLSPSFGVMVFARILQGISSGFISPITYNYIVELSDPSVRGRLVAMSDFFRQFGMVVMIITGSFSLTWRQLAYVQLAFVLPPFFVLAMIHDSPRWLALKGRYEEASASLRFYRGKEFDISEEFSQIKEQITDSSKAMSVSSQLRLIFTRNIFPIFLITSFMMLTQQFCGNNVIVSYSVSIFNSAEVNIDSYVSSIVIVIVRLFGIATFLAIGDKFRRKVLYTSAFSTVGLSSCVLGLFFYLKETSDVSSIQWLPLVSLTVYSYCVSISIPTVFVMRSELLPNSVRSLATGFQFALISSSTFLVVFCYPYMTDSMGIPWTFLTYGFFTFAVCIFTIVFVPETIGKTLEQIAESEEKKRSTKKNVESGSET